MYLYKTITSKTRINDIASIQLDEYKNNKGNKINQIKQLLKKYNIDETIQSIKSMKKAKWEDIVKTKIKKKANELYKKECENLKKLKYLNQTKTEIKCEKYINSLKQKKAIIMFTLRTRMINLRNNFRNKYQDYMCPRCENDIDDEEHLFNKCEKLKALRKKYDINNYFEVFDEQITIERMMAIVNFIEEAGIEKKE